jgi:hypothetical protein
MNVKYVEERVVEIKELWRNNTKKEVQKLDCTDLTVDWNLLEAGTVKQGWAADDVGKEWLSVLSSWTCVSGFIG